MGAIVVLFSALLFASATVGVKFATMNGEASAIHVTMARFLAGLLFMLPTVIRDPSILKPQVPRWVWLRAVSNVVAVVLFFFGVQLTTVSKANLLNMTYPVFVFLFAPTVTGEKNSPVLTALLALTLVGVWNVVRPENLHAFRDIAVGDVLAFGSAIIAGFAIAALRRTRRHDRSATIVFYIMAVGVAANAGLLFLVPSPDSAVMFTIIAAGTAGALGQMLLTVGFRHVSAAAGALLSTARIPIAGAMGIILFADRITPRTIVGAVLILVSLTGVTLYNPLVSALRRRASIPSRGTR